VAKAVAALSKHIEKVKSEGKSKLFDADGDDDGDGEMFNVMISMRKTPSKSKARGPHIVPHRSHSTGRRLEAQRLLRRRRQWRHARQFVGHPT
jgi:hypothetical protein